MAAFTDRFGSYESVGQAYGRTLTGLAGWKPMDDSSTIAQTETTEVQVGSEAHTATTTETVRIGGAIQNYLERGAIIFLGMIFVAAGLWMFRQPISLR